MKITPISAPMPQLASPELDVRRIKMNVNVTPNAELPVNLQAPTETTTGNSITPDTDEQNQAVDEATKPLSPQLVALAKQRRALQLKEQELAKREEALKAPPKSEGMIELAKLKSQPLRVLLENGVTYDQLTQAVLENQGYNPEMQKMQDELRAVKDEIDRKLTERDTQAEKQVIAEMTREAEAACANGDEFELVRESKSVPQVIELIERTYREKGQLLEVKQALQLVEDELLSDAMRFAQLNKVKSKLTPAQEAVVQQQKQVQPPAMRTLANKDGASRPMSARERAIAAFNGTLRK